ncbi:MAG: hypothetical protein HOV68_26040, partial [Streptomycetaceae bacterium]|nr:hypothetical protein [Streptomycetaceae bacterium]
GSSRPLDVKLVGSRQALDQVAAVTLHFRHVDQSKSWNETEMRREGDRFTALLPKEFTATSFPVMCFAEAHLTGQAPVLLPGFEPDLANQPYLVIHSTAWKAHHTGAERSTAHQRSLG